MNWLGKNGMPSRTNNFDADSSSLQRSSDTEANDSDGPGCFFVDEEASLDGSNCERRNPGQRAAASICEMRGRQGVHNREKHQDRSPNVHENSQERTIRASDNDVSAPENSGGSFPHLTGGVPREIQIRRPSRAHRGRFPPRRRRITLDSDSSVEPARLQEDSKPGKKSVGYIQRRNPIEQSNLRYRYVKLAMSMRRTDLSRRQLLYQNVHAVILANPARLRLRGRVLAGLLSGGGGASTDDPERAQDLRGTPFWRARDL